MIKKIISSWFLFFVNFFAFGQDPISQVEHKKYVGLFITNTSYHLYYKNPETTGEIPSGYFTPVGVNFGYRLNNRITIQAGLGYGRNKIKKESTRMLSPGNYLGYQGTSITNVVAVPLTFRCILNGIGKKIPVYATTTIMPAFGTTRLTTTETSNGTTTYREVKDVGLNTFFTAGLGFNYRIRKRIWGFGEVNLVKSNISGYNSKYYDWYAEDPKHIQLIGSLGLGINYDF